MATLTENETPTWVHRMRERGHKVSDARPGGRPSVKAAVAPERTRFAVAVASLRRRVLARIVKDADSL